MQHAAALSQLGHYWWTTQWHLVYSDCEWSSNEEDACPDLASFNQLQQPRDVLWADPFVVDHHGELYLFFKECPYRFWGRTTGSKGRICVMKYEGNASWSKPSPVLERPYHLSYPFIFRWKLNYYMIPETMENRTIEIYKAVEFPFRWQLHRTLMRNVKATDSTLFYSGSRWWMFTCREDNAPPNRDLHLYSTDDPVDGDWTPHPANPVVSGTHCARGAGHIFQSGGSFVRPAQDCSQGYGGAVQFRRIVTLTESEYREEPAGRLDPEGFPGARGVHTWNGAGGLRVADVRQKVARWRLC